MNKIFKNMLIIALVVVCVAFIVFRIWKTTPKTATQIFPELQSADRCQILVHYIMESADIRLEGEAFRDFLVYLEELKFYPIHRETNPYGAEVLKGNVYQVYFYKDSYLGQIAITDAGIVSDGSHHYEIRDEEAVSGWNALMWTYKEQYKES